MRAVGDTAHAIPAQTCHACGATADAISGADHDDAPGVGDITVCIRCAAISILGEGLISRPCDVATLDAEQRAAALDAQRTIKQFIARGRS